MTHWVGFSDNIAHPFYTIVKIVDRQEVNKKLMEFLQANGLLTLEQRHFLDSITNQIKEYWKLIKNMFLMANMRHREPDFNKINASIGACLELEYQYWKYFLSYYKL